MILKRNIILLFILIVGFNLFGQEDGNNNQGLLLKGKIILWPSVFTFSGYNLTIGFDYKFAKHHSLGIDYSFNISQDTEDYLHDSKGDLIISKATKFDNGLFVNYRYYIGTIETKNKSLPTYLGLYYRYSKVHWSFGSRYSTNESRHYETNNSLGLLVGTLIPFGKKTGLDINFGVHNNYRVKEILFNNSNNYNITNQQYISFLLRFNFYFWLNNGIKKDNDNWHYD